MQCHFMDPVRTIAILSVLRIVDGEMLKAMDRIAAQFQARAAAPAFDRCIHVIGCKGGRRYRRVLRGRHHGSIPADEEAGRCDHVDDPVLAPVPAQLREPGHQ
jgi:hypothetical protein